MHFFFHNVCCVLLDYILVIKLNKLVYRKTNYITHVINNLFNFFSIFQNINWFLYFGTGWVMFVTSFVVSKESQAAITCDSSENNWIEGDTKDTL